MRSASRCGGRDLIQTKCSVGGEIRDVYHVRSVSTSQLPSSLYKPPFAGARSRGHGRCEQRQMLDLLHQHPELPDYCIDTSPDQRISIRTGRTILQR